MLRNEKVFIRLYAQQIDAWFCLYMLISLRNITYY